MLKMPKAVYDELRAHGERVYPQECCGVLVGRPEAGGWAVAYAVRTGNAEAPAARRRYRIEPQELVRIQGEAARRDLEIAGFYHSHPDHPADWSPSDLAEAHWLGCCYVITAVVGGKAIQTNAFLLAGTLEEDKHFEREAIEVAGQRFPG